MTHTYHASSTQEQDVDAHTKPRPVPSVALWTRSGRLLQMSLSVPDATKAKEFIGKGACRAAAW